MEYFNIEEIKSNSSIYIINSNDDLRKQILQNILLQHKDISNRVVITQHRNENNLIHQDLTKDFVKNIMKKQKETIKNNDDARLIMIIDEGLLNEEKTNYLKQIIMSNRTYQILPILTMVNPYVFKPCIRENIDFIFIGYYPDFNHLYHFFINQREYSKDEFEKIIDDLKNKYFNTCLVVNNLNGKLYFYKIN